MQGAHQIPRQGSRSYLERKHETEQAYSRGRGKISRSRVHLHSEDKFSQERHRVEESSIGVS